jgi:hypothetical protein
MPTMVPTAIPRAPRSPTWPAAHDWCLDADGPSSQLDVEITQTRVEPWFPLPADDDAIVSDDGLLCVPRPRGPGWAIQRRRKSAGPATVTSIVCRRSRHTELFGMVAEDWDLPCHATIGARELVASAFARLDESSYRDVAERVRLAEHRGHPAYETTVEAMHVVGARKRRIVRVQRVVVVGTHALVLGAEGSLRACQRHAAERERFFESARFTQLR